VARVGGDLHVLCEMSGSNGTRPFPLVADGSPATGATGTLRLLQSKYGGRERNFQLVTPREGGGPGSLTGETTGDDPAEGRWQGPSIVDPGIAYHAASVIEGPFGPEPGNLELVAITADGHVRHFLARGRGSRRHDRPGFRSLDRGAAFRPYTGGQADRLGETIESPRSPAMAPTTPSPVLTELGWDKNWAAALALVSEPGVEPGRVSRIDRGAITVLTAAGPRRAASVRELGVAVGDWVAISAGPEPDRCRLIARLPRRFVFSRTAEGTGAQEQVVAANIDAVLVVDAIDGRLSLRHLERYLALAWQSGATPIVVITKADLASPAQVHERVVVVQRAAPGVAVHVVSSERGQGVDALARYLAVAQTAAVLGLSGAGKSTLVNHLAGADVLATGEVRQDGQGRHTTTHRQLVPLPTGGLIIDTPGMRALSIQSASDGIELAFADIDALSTRCHFRNCSHTNEHDCAIRTAVADGSVNIDRVTSWLHFLEQVPPVNRDVARVRLQDRKDRRTTAKADRRAVHNSKPRPPKTGPPTL
jgi:ribosome biogenesis GTPase / thiamine phosphate phosphatase